MGKKVDFSSKANKNKKKKIKIVAIVIGGVFVTYLIVESSIRAYKSLPQEIPENNKLYYSVDEFKTLEEVLNRYSCAFIRTSESDNFKQIYLTFDRDLYTGETSNENHFWAMTRVIAEFVDFENFELIDESRNITISVICEDTNIVEYKINGDENYYLNKNSEINSKKQEVETTKFTIQSKELQELIDNDWDEKKVNFGTKESTCNDYEIYFDEGIEYKKVGRKLYNLIFTDRYTGEIAGGLNANSTVEDVETALGTPTYSNGDTLYGYLGEYNYLFFDFINQQVSIYPIQTLTKEEEEKFIKIVKEMNDSLNVKSFTNDITDLWIDYDSYDFDSNYVDLKYTLRGIQLKISNNSLKNGIFIYQNYLGDKSIQNLENVYIEDTNLIMDQENIRVNNYHLWKNDIWHENEELDRYISKKFTLCSKGKLAVDEVGVKGPMFISRDNENANSELDRTILMSDHIWLDDYRIIYSVNYDGIYVYNCQTRVNAKIISLNEIIKLNFVSESKITYNDINEINVSIQ